MNEEIKHEKNDTPPAEIKAEGQTLEWGPQWPGRTPWVEIQEKIDEINSDLAEGEKPWRLPTIKELMAEFNKTNSTPEGFDRYDYWSSNETYSGSNDAYGINMINGRINTDDKRGPGYSVRLVRDTE